MSLHPSYTLHAMRGSVLIAPPTFEPVTLTEVRAQLALDVTCDDVLLTDFITEARQEIEAVTGVAMARQTWRLSLDAWPQSRGEWWDGVRDGAIGALTASRAWVELPKYPLVSISSVNVFAPESASFDLSNFDIDTAQVYGRVGLKSGAALPSGIRAMGGIQIDYVAGYATAALVPAPLRRAIRTMVAYMYSHRGDGCSTGDAYTASGAAEIAGRYRVVKV
jgi:uncharacterized phiE125 gp8 family phage protein